MIERTEAQGFGARHICHFAKPENPSWQVFRTRSKNVDSAEEVKFLDAVRSCWANLGESFEKSMEVTRYDLLNSFVVRSVFQSVSLLFIFCFHLFFSYVLSEDNPVWGFVWDLVKDIMWEGYVIDGNPGLN